MVTDFKEVQFSNALSFRVETWFVRVSSKREEHPLNAATSIVSRMLPNVTDLTDEQFSNALTPIVITL